MLNAFGLGTAAQLSLVLAGLIVFWVIVPDKIVGAFAGFGAGLLLSAVAFDLVPEAKDLPTWESSLWMLAGAAVFVVADRIVEHRFGGAGGSAALGIVIGSIVDGVPESIIFGTQIGRGLAISMAFLLAVFVSNIPQALAPSADLAKSGWSKSKVALMWAAVAVVCGIASALGWLAAVNISEVSGARAAALGAGGVLAMLTDSLLPFAFERDESMAGVWCVVGFCLSLAMS
jgi:zinc transporter, ZIP family